MAFPPPGAGQWSNLARSCWIIGSSEHRSTGRESPISDMGIWHVWCFPICECLLPSICLWLSHAWIFRLNRVWSKGGIGLLCLLFDITLSPPSFSLISHFICNLPSIPQVFLIQKVKYITPSLHQRKVKSDQKQQSWRLTRANATAARQSGPLNSTKEVISFGISFAPLSGPPSPLSFPSPHNHLPTYPSIHPFLPTKAFNPLFS